MSKVKKYRVVDNAEVGCPRCGIIAEAREHTFISEKQLRQNYYYSKWFHCRNTNCQTTTFMDDKYRVQSKPQRPTPNQQIAQMYEQQTFWMKNL